MSQATNNNRQKRLYALGGVVFGASAVAAVVASYNILIRDDSSSSSSTLRGSVNLPNANSGTDISLGKSLQYQRTSNVTSPAPSAEAVYQVISQNATSITTHFAGDRNSNDVAELISAIEAASHQGSMFPRPSSSTESQRQSSLYPTYSPTLEDIPTFSPTRFDDNLPKALPIKRSNENGFRLKMYWEEGYYWQENPNERWWCMSCQDDCVSGAKMELRDCEMKNDSDALFVAVPFGAAGHQFRVANSNLCLMKMGRGRAIKLKNCRKPNNKHFPLQLFKGFDQDDKFDLRPATDLDRCLSQHHHPKAKEIIYAETCKKAHRPDTGYWVKY